MNDKQQLQAMGEHQAEYGFLCFTKQIEDLRARLQECANGAAKMQEQRDYAYKMMGKFGGERYELAHQLEVEKMKSAAMAELLLAAAAPKPEQPAQRLTVENAPVGTLAPAIMGGHWYRTERGWKWNGPDGSGGTFPRPGGDWNGKLIAPKPEQTK